MIDWDELIGADNNSDKPGIASENGARPSTFDDDLAKVGRLQPSNHNGSSDSAPLAPLAPVKNKGVGLE